MPWLVRHCGQSVFCAFDTQSGGLVLTGCPYVGPPTLYTGLFLAMWMAGSILGAFIFIAPGLPWR
jgi:hypothetical protein